MPTSMSISGRRTPMVLFSNSSDQYSHRVRLVLREKRIAVKEIAVDLVNLDEDLILANPTGEVPALVDRDLQLYHSMVIMEYLDERYPHPPLLPIYPVARAEARLMIHRIQQEWAVRLDVIAGKGIRSARKEKAKNDLRESIISFAHQFSDQRKFFLNNEFTIVDCCVVPVLWRLDSLDITLPPQQTKNLRRYMNNVFSRESVITSLSEVEEEMRKA